MTDKKCSQNVKILDHLREHGVITNRIAMVGLQINNPFQRIKEVRALIKLQEMWVRKDKLRFKVFYILRSKAIAFAEYNNLVVE